MSGSGREFYRMSGSGRKAILNVREWSGGYPGCPGVVGSLPGCPGVVGRHTRISGSGRVALSDVREWLEVLPGV